MGDELSVSIETIENRIAREEYIQIDDTTTTLCILTVINGFVVVGKSACVSQENFDVKIGQDIARKNAIDQMWALEGYLLKERIWEA